MRLITFSDAKGARIGVHDAESATIVDLAATTRLPKDMTAFIALGRNGLKRDEARHIFRQSRRRREIDDRIGCGIMHADAGTVGIGKSN